MAARRASSRSRSGGRRSSRAAQTNNNTPVIIGVGVAVVAILIVVAVNMGGEDPDPSPKQPPKQAKPEQPAEKPAKKSSRGDAHLKDPDTPAPSLSTAFLSDADGRYQEAKKLHDDARRAQAAGDDDKFNRLINDSWDKMLELDEYISKYTEWLENADMEDWRVPASYSKLQSRINRWDKLKGGIKRIKPNRR